MVEEVIDPEGVKAQPGQWRCIGQEVSEQLDYEPGRFFRRRLAAIANTRIRPTWTLRPSLPQLAGTVAGTPQLCPLRDCWLTSWQGKYCDHLPLYRQEQIYQQRHGVNPALSKS